MTGKQKGISLKHLFGEDVLIIHQDTLNEYLSKLPKQPTGWHLFRIEFYKRLTHNDTFARIEPINPKVWEEKKSSKILTDASTEGK